MDDYIIAGLIGTSLFDWLEVFTCCASFVACVYIINKY